MTVDNAIDNRYKMYSEYKDSGVEWLGKIPSGWNAQKLKYLCTYNDDVLPESTPKDKEMVYVDIGSVSAMEGITNIETITYENSPSRARRIVRDGDVIISTVRTYLEAIAPINHPPENMVVSTGFAVIRPKNRFYKGFASYSLRVKGFIGEVVSRSVGVSYPAINSSDLVNIEIPTPSVNEQKQIANFLDHETAKIDTLIQKQQRLIELLTEKRQAVISHAVTKGLNPDVPMKDSGVEWLGEVPGHWEISPLRLYVDTRKGVAFKSVDFADIGIRVVKASDIKNRTILSSDIYLPESFANIYPKAVLRFGDIILSTVGSTPDVKNSAVGQVGILPRELDGSLLNQNTVVFSPRSKLLTNNFLFNLIQTDDYREHLDLHAHGTANQASLNVADMLNFIFARPPVEEQTSISTYIQQSKMKFDDLIFKAQQQIQLMQERRTALISAAVTGKIDVRDWVKPE